MYSTVLHLLYSCFKWGWLGYSGQWVAIMACSTKKVKTTGLSNALEKNSRIVSAAYVHYLVI